MRFVSTFLLTVLLAGTLMAQNPTKDPKVAMGEPVDFQPADFSSDETELANKIELKRQLWSAIIDARVSGTQPGRIELVPSAEALARLELAACEDCPVEDESERRVVGVNQGIDARVDLIDDLYAKDDLGIGRTAINTDGSVIWTTSISSEGATGLRVRFTNFYLADAMMFVYNDFGQVFGPYTGNGPNDNGKLWSHTISGDNIWIQIHASAQTDLDEISFNIAAISHMGANFRFGFSDHRMGKADCSANVSCVKNAQCYDDWDELKGARKATAHLIYSEDDYNGASYGCTGGTMNDNNSAHRKPWLLTANHCISSEDEADSIEARFGYKSLHCGTCLSFINDSVLGSDLRATGTDGDFTLLELSELPSGWGLLGWTSSKVRDTDGLNLYRISHPQGSPQSFSQHEVDAYKWANDKWIYSQNVIGTTEGQSSGSPIFKAGGIVVGQLKGKSYTSSYNSCVNGSNWRTKDGALNYYWKSVRPYLASGSSTSYKMHVSDITNYSIDLGLGISAYLGRADITVVDELGNGIPGVTVTGQFSNGLSGNYSATTNDQGKAVIHHGQLKPSSVNFTFCVTNLSHDYFNTYDSGSNVETCETY